MIHVTYRILFSRDPKKEYLATFSTQDQYDKWQYICMICSQSVALIRFQRTTDCENTSH